MEGREPLAARTPGDATSRSSRATSAAASKRRQSQKVFSEAAARAVAAEAASAVQKRSLTALFEPGSPAFRFSQHVRLVVALYYTFALPYRIAFSRPDSWLPGLLADWSCDLLFLSCCLVKLVTPYHNKKGAVESRAKKILRQYLKTGLLYDVIAVVPLDLMAVVSGVDYAVAVWLRVSRFLATRPLLAYLRRRNSDAANPSSLDGLRKVFLFSALIAHYGACLFFYMAYHNPDANWVSEQRLRQPELGSSFGYSVHGFMEYFVSLWWSFSLVTSMGAGSITPCNKGEILSFLCGDLVSLCWYSFVMMYVSDVLATQDLETVKKRDEYLAIGRFIAERGLTGETAADLVSYFDFRAANQLSDQNIFKELPRSLQLQVAREVCRPLVETSPVFRGCDDGFIDSLSVLLQENTVMPKTFIFRRNDFSAQLFFVGSGLVEITAVDPVTAVETKKQVTTGTCIGELAFFFGLRQPYSAMVSAAGHATVYSLQRSDFQALAKHFPDQEELIFKRVLGNVDDSKSVASGMTEGTGTEGGGAKLADVVKQAKEKREQEKTVAMLTAVYKGDLEEVKRFLLMDVDVDSADYDGRTALHLAACEGHVDILHLFIERGANVNCRDRYGGSPLVDAIRHKQDGAIRALLMAGAKLQLDDGANMINSSAAEGDLDTIRRLVETGLDPTIADYDGRTPLHLAACNGHLGVVEYLLGAGVDSGARDRNKGTPLQDAVRHKKHDIAEKLLVHGAEFGLQNASGVLCNAAAAGDVDSIRLLIRYGVAVSEPDYDGRTALHLAAAEGQLQALEYLILHGSDPSAIDRWNGNALHDAIRHKHKLCAQLLLDYGVEINRELGHAERVRVEMELEALLASRNASRKTAIPTPRAKLPGKSAAHMPGDGALTARGRNRRRSSIVAAAVPSYLEAGGRGGDAADDRPEEYNPEIVRALEEFEKVVADTTAELDREADRLRVLKRRLTAKEAKSERANKSRTASLVLFGGALKLSDGKLTLGPAASRAGTEAGDSGTEGPYLALPGAGDEDRTARVPSSTGRPGAGPRRPSAAMNLVDSLSPETGRGASSHGPTTAGRRASALSAAHSRRTAGEEDGEEDDGDDEESEASGHSLTGFEEVLEGRPSPQRPRAWTDDSGGGGGPAPPTPPPQANSKPGTPPAPPVSFSPVFPAGEPAGAHVVELSEELGEDGTAVFSIFASAANSRSSTPLGGSIARARSAGAAGPGGARISVTLPSFQRVGSRIERIRVEEGASPTPAPAVNALNA